MEDKKKGYSKYHNPDPDCIYPCSDDFVGYCWSYAYYVDGDEKFKDIKKICSNCPLCKSSPNYDPSTI